MLQLGVTSGKLQSLNHRRGGGQYFVHQPYPVFVEKIPQGWRLSASVPGFREAFLLQRNDRRWLAQLNLSRRLLRSTSLSGQVFKTRRDALDAWAILLDLSDSLKA